VFPFSYKGALMIPRQRLFMEVVKNQAGEKMAGKFAKYIPLIGTIVSCTVS
jgi:hypothetical protein